MTAHFGTDNIFYLPPGSPLTIYDLLHARKIQIHLQSLRVLMDTLATEHVARHGRRVFDFAEANEDPLDFAAERLRLDAFLDAMPVIADPPKSRDRLRTALRPLSATIWTRISQEPMESFFSEDYSETSPDSNSLDIIDSCFGSIAFNAISEEECELPSLSPPTFHLTAFGRQEIAEISPLDPLAPLPLLREYCGFAGSSNQGEAVTIDLNGGLPEACLIAAPVRRTANICYETIYMHIKTGADAAPVRPIPHDGASILSRNLQGLGFKSARRDKRFSVWAREDTDVIQLYRGLLGKESENRPVLPPFAFCPLAEGGQDAEARSGLLNKILGQ